MTVQLGLDLKERGLSAVEGNSITFQELMRAEAIRLSTLHGCVDVDDLREIAALNGLEPHHPNAWGAVFRGKCWVPIGAKRSRIPSNHARVVRVWQYKPERGCR